MVRVRSSEWGTMIPSSFSLVLFFTLLGFHIPRLSSYVCSCLFLFLFIFIIFCAKAHVRQGRVVLMLLSYRPSHYIWLIIIIKGGILFLLYKPHHHYILFPLLTNGCFHVLLSDCHILNYGCRRRLTYLRGYLLLLLLFVRCWSLLLLSHTNGDTRFKLRCCLMFLGCSRRPLIFLFLPHI